MQPGCTGLQPGCMGDVHRLLARVAASRGRHRRPGPHAPPVFTHRHRAAVEQRVQAELACARVQLLELRPPRQTGRLAHHRLWLLRVRARRRRRQLLLELFADDVVAALAVSVVQPVGEDRVVEAQRRQVAVQRRLTCVESGQRRLCVAGRHGAEPLHALLVLWDGRALCPEEEGAVSAPFILIRVGRHLRSGWEASQATPEVSKGGSTREIEAKLRGAI